MEEGNYKKWINRINAKQDKLNETNFGQFMDVDLATKVTPSVNDTFLGRDSLTNKAVELPMDYIQPKLTNPITGTGTTNYLSKFKGSGNIGNSQIFDNGTNIGIGTNTPQARLDVRGFVNVGHLLEMQYGDGTYGAVKTIIALRPTSKDPNEQFFNGFTFDNSLGLIELKTTNDLFLDYVRTFGISSKVWNGASYNISPRFIINSSGDVGIGTSSPGAKLDVRAQGALSTDIAFRVRNSVDTANLLQVNGQGTLSLGLQSSAPTGIEGAIYYNSTDKKHYGFNGTTWNALY